VQVLQHVPGPPLSEHVGLLWLHDGYIAGHAQERLLPTGSMNLIVGLRDETALFVGAHSQPGLLDTSQAISVIGAYFQPGGAFPFLNLPASELHNLDVELGDLWPAHEACAIRERLHAAPMERKLAVLECALLERLRRPRNPFVAFAIRELRRGQQVKPVAEQIGVSQRTFINAFAREVGMTPKLFSRVKRFQRALRMVHGRADVDWSEVALACGYFDQPHFNRDFREFSGLTPSEYLERRTPHLNHVPV
jgi:AraC-like DNA-binding protein